MAGFLSYIHMLSRGFHHAHQTPYPRDDDNGRTKDYADTCEYEGEAKNKQHQLDDALSKLLHHEGANTGNEEIYDEGYNFHDVSSRNGVARSNRCAYLSAKFTTPLFCTFRAADAQDCIELVVTFE